jgi:vacuolar-type H+-ATPase subunit D/Vma8
LAAIADVGVDINSELDELDREEFYRLKKACLD